MFYDATLYMSNSKFVTLSPSIPIYNSLLEYLEKLADVNDKNYCNSSEVRIAILKGYKNLKHTIRKRMIHIPMQLQLVIIFFQFYFCLIYTFYISVFFLIYYVSIVIDPQFKLGYYQKQEWEQYYIDAAKKIFTDTFKNFYQDNIDDANNRENTNDESDFLFNILGGNNNNDYNEAEAYLQQPVASIKTDPLT